MKPQSIKTILFLVVFTTFFANSYAQKDSVTYVTMEGPRFGVTYLTPGQGADDLKDLWGGAPFFTQFGWQFEQRFGTLDNKLSFVAEGVILLGGMEQGMFLPSASFLVGVRNTINGFEIGFGPNLSLAGAAFVVAAGTTFESGGINFPVNLSVVPSAKGVRISFLLGFNTATN